MARRTIEDAPRYNQIVYLRRARLQEAKLIRRRVERLVAEQARYHVGGNENPGQVLRRWAFESVLREIDGRISRLEWQIEDSIKHGPRADQI